MGAGGEAVGQVVTNRRRLGHAGKVLLENDNEPALHGLRQGVVSKLGIQADPERPPAHEPQSNGAIENAVNQFKGMFRTVCVALESRIAAEVPVTHPITMWLTEHVAELLAKYLVGRDGKTPHMSGSSARGIVWRPSDSASG